MSTLSISVLCTQCGLVSRRPGAFVRARRSFVCGGCKEIIPLDGQTILSGPGTHEEKARPGAGAWPIARRFIVAVTDSLTDRSRIKP